MTVRNNTIAAFACLPLGGCEWMQSALAPGGPEAESAAKLGWLMFIGGGIIFLVVMALTMVASLAGARRMSWLGQRSVIIGGGIVFPVVTLSALLLFGLLLTRNLVAAGPPALRVEVVGEQYWWRVHYVDAFGSRQLVTANEIRIPTGLRVKFILKSNDVNHSFWVPSLAGKLDMIPGRQNMYQFAAERPGVYRGQCAEYCGAQHAKMAFYLVAMERSEFDAWFARESEPAVNPSAPFLVWGKSLLLQNGCGACHTIRGTPADGTIGPDLTHVGGRLSLAAGTFPNNIGTLAGWISSAGYLKQGSLMPSFGNLQGEELRAIAAYLESLK
ncbi:MAG: cytochrome c oxidase subunit II [Methylocella sp.]